MEVKKILIIIGIIILIAAGIFVAYIYALGSAWALHTTDKSPFYITTEPMVIKNISLPKETKIRYNKQFFWQKFEQKKPLKEKYVKDIEFKKGVTVNWGRVPIKRIVKFYNETMTGYSVYADFTKLTEEKATPFSNRWKSCNDDLGITVKNSDDWSFNKTNILDVNSCGVNKQRYFKDDKEQQQFLDDLLDGLKKVEE